mmetsp:Transcript_34970/g.81832  ORF Transcript_34970/g.81832 Transcript_34970/m.81832 type:complete len:153 (-) Transcript_34970:78-536(-)|eukprot:CAMPEP_0178419960 /NCGR_PEP_ID=MMETSP0689_2-20121128/25883_1 /TAXON_ID=160604 /ORGANISM="Amphidinium massartii, Strain CS-259" /LENGTH=152 /DNA_ID=CAMNT_0020041421 /DNA_START=155 /DNA_END=613 /DNA_ORIENTATION=-
MMRVLSCALVFLLAAKTSEAAGAVARGGHCLLQADMERLSSKGQVSLKVNATASASESQSKVVGALQIPNGPAFMNRTKMNEKTLPDGSRHANMKTYTADWREEYPQPPPVPIASPVTLTKKPIASSGAASDRNLMFVTLASLLISVAFTVY